MDTFISIFEQRRENSGRTADRISGTTAHGFQTADAPLKKGNDRCLNIAKGFSINEVMISMFIMSVGIVTVISLFSNGFINSQFDRDRIVAAGLAQEGVELVKNIRDNDFAVGGNGFTGFGNLSSNRDVCGLDYTDTQFVTTGNISLRNCFGNGGGGNVERRFSLVPSGGYFTNPYSDSGTVTKFARTIYIDYDSAGPSASVTSMVWWGGNDTLPSGVLDGDNNPSVVSACTAANKCVYSKMQLENWKP